MDLCTNWKNWNFEARLFGNSLFRLSQEQKDKITSKLLDIANDREASPMMKNFGTNKWLESYSIPLPEAEEDAVLCLLNLITHTRKKWAYE
jgi:hypothetical protein